MDILFGKVRTNAFIPCCLPFSLGALPDLSCPPLLDFDYILENPWARPHSGKL